MSSTNSTQKLLIRDLLTPITCFQSPAVWADAIITGESPVSYCFQIANLDEYPNYLLIAHVQSENSNLPTRNRIFEPDKCLRLYGYREYSDVYAIKKSLVKPPEIITSDDGDKELQDFNAKKAQLLPAAISIKSIRTMSEIYGVKEVADVLEVEKITDKFLYLRYKEVVYTSILGTLEKRTYDNQRPLPFNFLLLFMIMLIVLMTSILLIYKKNNFSRHR
jgi:hypothetical protein